MWTVQTFYICFTFFNQIVCDIYKPIFFEEEEVRHVRDASAHKPPCDEEILVGFLAEAQITNPESIVGIAITDFEATCRSTSTMMKKIETYMKNCTASQNLYLNLINGLKSFDEKLCRNNEFYKRYENYDKCISDLDNDFDSCDGAADWNENEDQARVCKIYKKIIDCYYIKTAKVCGIRAALTLKELMIEVIDCTLTIRCHVGSAPSVKDPMPDKYINSLNKGSSTNIYSNIQIMLRNLLVVPLFYFIFT